MAIFERGEIRIHYEESGEGFPVLLFAPGGMRSAIPVWANSPFNPIEVLSPHFRVIAMDQRNAGESTAPVSADDGWHTYTEDHLALLDHLGIEKCHVMGGCIGGPYCFGVMERDPGRVAAAVIQQTIGMLDNRDAFYQMFDMWADALKESRTEVSADAWASFRSNMYDREFLFNVDRDFIRACTTPMLVLMGNDLYHPQPVSRELAELAPNATLVEQWKEPEVVEQTVATVIEFLKRNTP